MRTGFGLSLAIGLSWALVVACGSTDAFVCMDDSVCVNEGIGGVCQPLGYCSFPDPTCDSGYRYGDNAREDVAMQCVPVDEPLPTSGPETSESATTTMAPPETSGSTSLGAADSSSSSTATTTGIDPGTGSSTGTTSDDGSSGGSSSCTQKSCAACHDCVDVDRGGCAPEFAACMASLGCSAVVQCLADCGLMGLCFDPCCDGADDATIAAAEALATCRATACADACQEFDLQVQCN